METLHMQDVIHLLGLPAPPSGKSSYYIPCPCCDDKPKSRHLNINLQKNVFRCPRCGFSGGVLDMYAVFAGVPRGEAYKALAGKRTFRAPAPREEKKPQAEENPLLDVDARHATYQSLLSRLSLATDHRENRSEEHRVGKECRSRWSPYH